MKKVLFSIFILMLCLFVLASCDETTDNKDDKDKTQDPTPEDPTPEDPKPGDPQEDPADKKLAREDGKMYFVTGQFNGWGPTEGGVMAAVSLNEVKAVDAELAATLAAKGAKYVYALPIELGKTTGGWAAKAMVDGKKMELDGIFTVKVILGGYDEEDEAYTQELWIPDPHKTHVEALTDNLFIPVWQEALDENGFSWADNPVVTSGAGTYLFLVADYGKVSDAETAGYGFALIKAADLQGDGTVLEPQEVVEPANLDTVLAREDGKMYFATGAFNGWAPTEGGTMAAMSINDVKELDEALATLLASKDVKYLYGAEIELGLTGAGWTSAAMVDGKKMILDGIFAVKVILGGYDEEDEVYTQDLWISDPHKAHVEALNENVFLPTWQEALDENGFAWNMNPMCISGAGKYMFIIADYGKVSDAETAAFGFALIKTGEVEGDGTVLEPKAEDAPNEEAEMYSLIGEFNNTSWDYDADFEKIEGVWTLEIALYEGDRVKVRENHSWVKSYGYADLATQEGLEDSEGNISIVTSGTYVITFDVENAKVSMTLKGEEPQEPQFSEEQLARTDSKLYFATGSFNGWGPTEGGVMAAMSLADVAELDVSLASLLDGKAKYLYGLEIELGLAGAGWTTKAMVDGTKMELDGIFAVKVILGGYDEEDEVYTQELWIPDPHKTHAESLTDNLFMPVWQEAVDENGFSWADNPVVISGAGKYMFIIADYGKVSEAETAGYGFALIKTGEVEGDGTVAEPTEVAAPVDPSEATYSIIGAFGDNNWDSDIDLELVDGVLMAEVEFAEGDEFKVRVDHDWATSYGDADGNNIVIAVAGTYVVIFNTQEGKVQYALKGYSLIGSFGGHNWDYDLDLELTEGLYVAEVELAEGDEVKVRKDHMWMTSFGFAELDSQDGFEESGGNIKITETGTYVVSFDAATGTIMMELKAE